MEEKKYLKWYNKVGYGSGDIAGNVVYALLSAFVMIFLTDTVLSIAMHQGRCSRVTQTGIEMGLYKRRDK